MVDTPPRLIAIYSSAPGAGKSTIANHLSSRYSYVRSSFAKPMRVMLDALYKYMGINSYEVDRRLYHDKEDPVPEIDPRITTRHLLRTLGTEWGRECAHPDIWIRAWQKDYERSHPIPNYGPPVVVDDLRFPNEAAAIKSLGGELWHVNRDSLVTKPSGHASDGALDGVVDFDRYIVNCSTISDLLQVIDRTIMQPEPSRGYF
jgi:hypothetical protein